MTETPWTPLPDDITERYQRTLHGYTLTVSRALYRWSWRIERDGMGIDSSEPMFTDLEEAMAVAEEVAGVNARLMGEAGDAP